MDYIRMLLKLQIEFKNPPRAFRRVKIKNGGRRGMTMNRDLTGGQIYRAEELLASFRPLLTFVDPLGQKILVLQDEDKPDHKVSIHGLSDEQWQYIESAMVV